MAPAEDDREITGVVAHAFVLLVRVVVLLVDDDQAELAERREQGGARADRHRRLPGPDPPPLREALGPGEAGVQDRDVVAEARAEAADELRREPDLGDEHQHLAPLADRVLRRAEVDLGLAGAGDAVEQERPGRAGRRDRGERGLLVGVERGRKGAPERRRLAEQVVLLALGARDDAGLLEPGQGVARGRPLGGDERAHVDRAARALQRVEDRPHPLAGPRQDLQRRVHRRDRERDGGDPALRLADLALAEGDPAAAEERLDRPLGVRGLDLAVEPPCEPAPGQAGPRDDLPERRGLGALGPVQRQRRDAVVGRLEHGERLRLHRARERRLDHQPERREVVVGDPPEEGELLVVERRRRVEQPAHRLDAVGGDARGVVGAQDVAGERAAGAERHEDDVPGLERADVRRHRVGEGVADRAGDRDVDVQAPSSTAGPRAFTPPGMKRIPVALWFLGVALPASAATPYGVEGAGAIATGGAAVANADDNTALSVNPAVIGLSDRYAVDLIGGFFDGRDVRFGGSAVDATTTQGLALGVAYQRSYLSIPLTVDELPGWGAVGAEPATARRFDTLTLGVSIPVIEDRLAFGAGGTAVFISHPVLEAPITGNLTVGAAGRPA